MSSSIVKKFPLGEEGIYYYLFNVRIYKVPGDTNLQIATIMMLSSNLKNVSKDIVNPYLQELILFLANLVVEYNACYDVFHNRLLPYSQEECENIAKQVNNKANEIKMSMSISK